MRARRHYRYASTHRRVSRQFPNRPHRPLRFEPLEDRSLLSITVNTLADENDGIAVGGISLRDALAAAVANDTINFAPALTSRSTALARTC
jgi:hypothetical protein